VEHPRFVQRRDPLLKMADHECCPACAKYVSEMEEPEWLLEWWGGCCCVDTTNKARASMPQYTKEP
jgi:hypothetical protein